MNETTVSGLNFFKTTDVRSVKEALSAQELSTVQRHVQTLIGNLTGLVHLLTGSTLYLQNGKLSTGHVQFAAFRIETLSLIFEYAQTFMRSTAREDLYPALLGALGHHVGFTYGREILRNLRTFQSIPADDMALVELWALFENDTGAGVTTLQKINDNTFAICLKNNPLGFFYTGAAAHAHCHFYVEYYRAILNEFFTTRPRLARDFMPDLKPTIWKVAKIEERPRNGSCVFEIHTREERLTPAFDLLHIALTEMDNGKYGDAVAAAREALTVAQKQKLFQGCENIPKDFYKGFKSILCKRDFQLMDDTYQRACGIVHKSKTKDPREMGEIVRHIRYCIHEIERADVNNADVDVIRKQLSESK